MNAEMQYGGLKLMKLKKIYNRVITISHSNIYTKKK